MYPRVQVSGSPRERGRSYGEQARERILTTRAGYEAAFGELAGWTWTQSVQAAEVYRTPILKHAPEVAEEMAGLAEGAGLSDGDVLAMNARTEVIWAATARQAAVERAALTAECTAFSLRSERTAGGYPLIGQNWDWLVHTFDTLIVLEVEQLGDRPNYVTVVEAGLLAKTTLNSAGVGVTTNALVTSEDRGDAGIPYHVMLRLLADCETVTDAIRVVQVTPRAASGNYLIAGADDTAVDLETAPGDQSRVTWQVPRDGVLTHTNHFIDLPRDLGEVSVYAMPDTLVRLQRAAGVLAQSAIAWDLDSLAELMTDHTGWPASICRHPDPRTPAGSAQFATVMSMIMSPAERRAWLASGPPCQNPYEELELGDLLSKPSALESSRAAGVGQVRGRA